MGNKANIQCPQCFHLNSLDTMKCTLCDWPLKDENLDKTQLFNKGIDEIDANLTTAPNLEFVEGIDPDVTQAPTPPSHDTTNPVFSMAEKQTFHLAGDLAHFEVREILGQGGMGAVYHARDITLQRDVAIKMLRPLQIGNQLNNDTLLDEARMASKLNHPNIVTIYDVARSKDSNYIVMEWVDGQPLDELIPDKGLELEKALKYACQIVDGLTNAHEKYIIHRDIKPQNIMLGQQNNIKILDFGIAGYINNLNEDNNGSTDSEQTTIGTPSYMSPEQAQGLNLDQRTDIFSFGIVLYQMLTGKRPFIATNLTELKKLICTGDYLPIQKHLPDLPSNVVNLVEKMLKIKKDERWQSSRKLSCELHKIYKDLTYKKNWWQRRSWLYKAAILLPFVLAIGWSSKEILFPASTQQLIERQLKEANKIAILPFNNISGDPLIQLFGDGLAVNLGSDLSAIASHQGNTWIVPSTEISRMKDQSVKKVADKYGVNLILTGSIQHMGSTRLLVLNLINAQDGQQLKTVEVSIDAEKLFQGHAEIRKQALALLNWIVPDELSAKFQADRPQLDGAYKEYIKGIGYFYRFDQPNNLIKAAQSFKTAIELSPNYPLAFIGLAESQLMNFRQTKNNIWLDEMEKTITILGKISSDQCQVDYLKAELLTRKGEYHQAINLFNNCIKKNPKHISSYLGLANAYAKNGDRKSAENYYEKAIKISPNNVKSIIDSGIFHYYNGNHEKAIEQSKLLAKVAPNNVNAYIYLAGNYYALGEIEKAISYTLFAIELKPTDSAYSNLATMYFSKGEYQKAVSAYELAIELNPSYYIFWGNLADAYKLTGSSKTKQIYNKAVELASEALKTNPNDSSVKANLAYYLVNNNNMKKALFYANQIGENSTGWENFLVAQAYDQLNMIDDSIKHLKYAIDKSYSIEEIRNTPLLVNTRKNEKFESLFIKNNNFN